MVLLWHRYKNALLEPLFLRVLGVRNVQLLYFTKKMFCNVFIGWTHKVVHFPGNAFGIMSCLAPFAP